MKLSPRTAAELAALNETFEEPAFDLVQSLTRFSDEVRLAVPSYLGLSVVMTAPTSRTAIDVIDEASHVLGVRSSLMIPASLALAKVLSTGSLQPEIALIVYASRAGALVDLAADLGWLTSIGLPGFALDEHLDGPGPVDGSLTESSLINQAIGALLAQGLPPEAAERAVIARAESAGTSRAAAALAILEDLTGAATTPPEVP
jgi:hypothetical protein